MHFAQRIEEKEEKIKIKDFGFKNFLILHWILTCSGNCQEEIAWFWHVMRYNSHSKMILQGALKGGLCGRGNDG